ncbi:MAG: M48 family metallopeptidase [Deltaproteobacteria bacterium]|nr:M48 family metallopeptidase [Deltaproteobacteria bacterium]
MSTQFFEHQEKARRNTSRLVFLFGLATVAIAASLYGIAAVATGFRGTDPATQKMVFQIVWLDPVLMLQVGVLTLVVVGGASLYRTHQLAGGGRVVAEALGGRLLHADSSAPLERKILNVVEEMAIASGTPSPPVYLLEHEVGINAFAAGYSPSDAVVGITRGCAEQLSRDELQGVVAHEFSHILNGDMRLNIRLMGVLYGILVIGMIGYFLLRSSFWAGAASRRNSKDNSAMAMAAVGFGLVIVGFLGTFFGNLIKASVSRQREFLADASAVQFTRNPDGIAGALKKIGGFEAGSHIESPAAPESSHLFFGQALSSGLNSLFATHPPLAERIKVLDPSWEGASGQGAVGPGAAAGVVGAPSHRAAAGFAGGGADAPAASAVEQMGSVTVAHLAYAAQLLGEIPPAVKEAAHDSFGARAVVYALLMDADSEARKLQLAVLDEKGEGGVPELTRKLMPEVERLGRGHRLPLIDLALPALRELSASQYERFQGVVHDLVLADQRIDLFEWTLQRILLTHLTPTFEGVQRPRKRLRGKKQVRRVLKVILSTLVRAGTLSESAMQQVVAGAGRDLGEDELQLLPPDEVGLAQLDEALSLAASLVPGAKERVLRACAQVIAADRKVAESEAELFRAIADSLGCPVPPLLPGQPLA